MRLFLTADANEETRVGEAVRSFAGAAELWFRGKEYGSGLDGVGIIVTCRDPDLNLRQRIRLHKQRNDAKSLSLVAPDRIARGEFSKPLEVWFDMDLMLDYNEFVKEVSVQQYSLQVSAKLYHTDEEREQIVRRRIVEEVPAVLRRYVTRKKNPLKDFDVDRFERDLRKCLLEGGLEEVTPEYNRQVEKERQEYER
jgi:hypothetical protein